MFYIAYGKMLAKGNEQEIIQSCGITVYDIEGAGLVALANGLRQTPGILSVASFGNSIHVASQDQNALEGALKPLLDQDHWRVQNIQANLEDVFIALLANVEDNFRN